MSEGRNSNPEDSFAFIDVLRDELNSFDEKRTATPEQEVIDRAHASQLAGLAFSGGGIRSATFNLGVLQALADLGLLRKFHYLSTVSGGGYIGAWLTAWVYRCENVPEAAGNLAQGDLEGVTNALKTAWKDQRGSQAPEEIGFLRRFSNYLTPKLGWLGADTWTVIAIYLRNVLLNMTILIGALISLVMLPRIIGLGVSLLPNRGLGFYLLVTVFFCLLVTARCFAYYNLSYFQEYGPRASNCGAIEKSDAPWYIQQSGIQLTIIWPLLLAGLLTVRILPLSFSEELGGWISWIVRYRFYGICLFAVVTLLIYLTAWVKKDGGGVIGRVIDFVSALVIAATLGGLILDFIHRHLMPTPANFWLRLVWMPPAFILTLLLTLTIYLGLRGRYLDRNKNDLSDGIREWWSRLGAWLLIYAILWVSLFGIAFYSPPFLRWLAAGVGTALAGLGFAWALTTVSSLIAAKSPATGKSNSSFWMESLVTIGPYVFIIGLFALLAWGIDSSLRPPESSSPAKFNQAQAVTIDLKVNGSHVIPASVAVTTSARASTNLGQELRREWLVLTQAHLVPVRNGRLLNSRLWLILLASLGTVLLLSARVDVNEFSMHTMYRDRLTRCYLGASNRKRRVHPFTGFDSKDDIRLAELWQRKERGVSGSQPSSGKVWDKELFGPYPIINCSLNLVGGDELAWQERKAAPFVFTPRFCGYDFPSLPPGYRKTWSDFDSTSIYAGSQKPMTLATAMAISGAAVSPNMGYHSSPASAFLMTLFNVRLGWWIGNPRDPEGWLRSSPNWAFYYLVTEMLGLTGAAGKYIYLSDGGHFENLGIFELVRRRCRFIIACDAEDDHEFKFEGLGNAIEKCRTDLGVNIELDVEAIRNRNAQGHSRWHCAVGRIRYDRSDPNGHAGTLLYIKSSLTGDEPTDVLHYAARNPSFPHETTGDQWFGESQFESYRSLGHHATMSALLAVDAPEELASLTSERLFVELAQRWYPPGAALDPAFARRGETLNELYETLRTDSNLRFLHDQIYPEWRVLVEGLKNAPSPSASATWLPQSYQEVRAGFYFCNRMIQLMEDVYHDLHLEREYGHPDNRGWINLFRHWAWSRMFRVTWTVSAATCGARFQNFCERHLWLKVGRVHVVDRSDLWQASKRPVELTRIEWDILKSFSRYKEQAATRTELRLVQVTPGDPPDEGPGFYAGFFLLGAGPDTRTPGKILYFRIRDHLRRMGLGRRAIYRLLEEDTWSRPLSSDHSLISLDLLAPPEILYEVEDNESRRLFSYLYQGVRAELDATLSKSVMAETRLTGEKDARSYWLDEPKRDLWWNERMKSCLVRPVDLDAATVRFDWRSDDRPVSQVMVHYQSENDATRIVVQHRSLASRAVREEMEQFWESALHRLYSLG